LRKARPVAGDDTSRAIRGFVIGRICQQQAVDRIADDRKGCDAAQGFNAREKIRVCHWRAPLFWRVAFTTTVP
jgi:hypothetical protein